MLGQNYFAEPDQHVWTFLTPILMWRVTYRVALKAWHYEEALVYLIVGSQWIRVGFRV